MFNRRQNKPETRAEPKQEERGLTYQEGIAAGLVLEPVDSGVIVNNEKVLTISAMYAGIRHISETLAALPKKLNEYGDDRERTEVPNHPAHILVAHEPNQYQTSFVFHEWLFVQCIVYSNGFGKLLRNGGGRVTEMIPLPAPYVQVGWDGVGGKLTYHVSDSPYTTAEVLSQDDVIHIPGLSLDGIFGLNPLEYQRQSNGISIAVEKFAASFFGKACRPSGVLEKEGVLSDKSRGNLRTSWRRGFAGAGNTGETPILEDGLKWKPTSITNEEAQFLETKNHQIAEASRWCKIPLVKLDPTRATWGNIESYQLQYVAESLQPWIIKTEQEYNRKLLLPSEKGKYCFEFDLSGLLRGDKTTRYNCYKIALDAGFMTKNEVRAQEGLAPIEGGDELPQPQPQPMQMDQKQEDNKDE